MSRATNIVLTVVKRVTAPDAALSCQARLLAVVLADIVNYETGQGWAHQKTLAKRLGRSVRTVQRAWRELDGVLFTRSFPGQTAGKPHKSARYTYLAAAASEERPAGFDHSPRRPRRGRSSVYQGNVRGVR